MAEETLNFGITDEFTRSTEVVDTLFNETPLEDLEKIDAEKEKAEKEAKEKAELEAKKKEKAPLTTNEIFDEDDKEEEKEEEDDKEEEEKEVSDNQFENISKGLVRLGVFTDDEKVPLPKTPDEFAQRFQEEKTKQASEWINNFLSSEHGEEGIDVFQAIFVDKVDPREYFATKNEITNLQELDLTDETAQKKVFREYYKRLDWKEDKIEGKLQRAIDNGELAEDSTDFHEQLVKQDAQKLANLQEENKKKENFQKGLDEAYRDNIQKILNEQLKNKELDGLPLTEKSAKDAFDFLYTKKYKTPEGQRLTEFDKFILESKNPENVLVRLKIALLAQNNFDFQKIGKRAITKETNKLFEELEKKQGKKTERVKAEKDWFTTNL